MVYVTRGIYAFLSIFHRYSCRGDIAKVSGDPYTQKISRTNLTIWILALFLALNAVDCFLTVIIVRNGAGWEGNYIWSSIPVWYKMFLATVIGIVVAGYRPRLLLPLNLGLLAIVLWNLTVWGCYG